jgi:ribosomal RNA-processing protein 8
MSPPLFQVPGWSVGTEPVSSSSSKKSKKRKRPHGLDAPSEKLESVQVNLEKLMDTLDRGDSVKGPPKKKHKGKQRMVPSEGAADNKPATAAPSSDSVKAKTGDARKPSKKPTKSLPASKEKGKSESQYLTKVSESEDSNLTVLQNRMKKKLDGARFR